ncbi:hypothetical protein ACFQ1Q_07275 [Winogradskyella litorisediminis]|uniref:Auto-transporter adhesin head GIN domain-containing protein n=1 Tax=Winogradskyella litorisediminis TaxID=1156618 RepID=A0ABW3N6S8_9FLAO
MKTAKILFFSIIFILISSCENDDVLNSEVPLEYIIITINDDFEAQFEIFDDIQNECEFNLSISDELFLWNPRCEAHNNSEFFFTITSFQSETNIPINLNGTFGGNELEAILGFKIPYPNSMTNDLRLFQMLNGTVDILASGEVGEYLDFQFSGEALLIGSPAEVVNVAGEVHLIRDN